MATTPDATVAYCLSADGDGVTLTEDPTDTLALGVDVKDNVKDSDGMTVIDADAVFVAVGVKLADTDIEGLVSVTGGDNTSLEVRPLPNWPLLLPPQQRNPESIIKIHV